MDLLVLLAAVFMRKLFDFVRYIVHGDLNGIVSQLLIWLFGIVFIYCLVWAEWTGMPATAPQRVISGLFIASFASTVHDFLTAWARLWTRRVLLDPPPPRPVDA